MNDQDERKRILLVEDHLSNCELARDLLKHAGFEVFCAHDGAHGIQVARERAPDLILMDLDLPDMNGLAAVQELKNNPATSQTPIVAFTAHAMKIDFENALRAGCVGYVGKPIDTRTFAATVGAFLPLHESKPNG